MHKFNFYNMKLHTIIIGVLISGTLLCTGVNFAHTIHVNNTHAQQIRLQNSRIQHAVSVLGNQNTGEANLTYYRKNHTLVFQITNYNFRDKFKGNNLKKQLFYFTRTSHLPYINPQVHLTKNAIRRHKIQLNEQADQRQENHLEAQRIIAQAKAKQRAIQHTKKVKHDKQILQRKEKQLRQIEKKNKQARKNTKNKKKMNNHAKNNRNQKHNRKSFHPKSPRNPKK